LGEPENDVKTNEVNLKAQIQLQNGGFILLFFGSQFSPLLA
jgi:hypothetical protein